MNTERKQRLLEKLAFMAPPAGVVRALQALKWGGMGTGAGALGYGAYKGLSGDDKKPTAPVPAPKKRGGTTRLGGKMPFSMNVESKRAKPAAPTETVRAEKITAKAGGKTRRGWGLRSPEEASKSGLLTMPPMKRGRGYGWLSKQLNKQLKARDLPEISRKALRKRMGAMLHTGKQYSFDPANLARAGKASGKQTSPGIGSFDIKGEKASPITGGMTLKRLAKEQGRRKHWLGKKKKEVKKDYSGGVTPTTKIPASDIHEEGGVKYFQAHPKSRFDSSPAPVPKDTQSTKATPRATPSVSPKIRRGELQRQLVQRADTLRRETSRKGSRAVADLRRAVSQPAAGSAILRARGLA